MADNVKTLRRRLRSIRNTKQITRAMEMVSAAKLRRAQDLFQAGQPYAQKLQELVGHLAATGEIQHPLFEARDVRKRVLVIVTADRGLAGSFNAQIIKQAESFLRESTIPTSLVCIGKKGSDYFRTKQWPILFSVNDLGGKPSASRSTEIAERLAELFLSGETDEVQLLYNTFVSTLVYRATFTKMLPLDAEALLGKHQGPAGPQMHLEYYLIPDQKQVLESLLPRFVRSKLYITLAETFTAEHSARMVAMSGATKNCEELIEAVSLRMNKARQAAITKEIIEVVSGAQALGG